MKAAVFENYGPPSVMELKRVEKPTPKDNEVLIRIKAATVTAGDCEMRRFDMPTWIWLPLRLYMGLFKPRNKILGQELSGVVEEVGNDVKNFKIGDNVLAPTAATFGAYAEYICLDCKHPIGIKPEELNFQQAATLPTGGLNAHHFLKKGKVQAGDNILINGAGGSIGTYAIQLAKHAGAIVTACDSAEKLPMLKSIGADYVVDYEEENVFDTQKQFDAVIDVVGVSDFWAKVGSVSSDGVYVVGNPRFSSMGLALWTWFLRKIKLNKSNRKVINALAPYLHEDLDYLLKLVGDKVLIPVIDREYDLAEIIEAHSYVESGAKKGNVVVNI